MHLAPKRVEHAKVTGAIGVDVNRGGGHRKQPRLGIVRARSKHGCPQWPTIAVGITTPPVTPWREGRTRRTGEYAPIPRTISKCNKGKGSCPGGDHSPSPSHGQPSMLSRGTEMRVRILGGECRGIASPVPNLSRLENSIRPTTTEVTR